MGKSRRVRRGLAWAGTVICLLLVVIFGVSLFGTLVRLGGNGLNVAISSGAVQVVQNPRAFRTQGWRWEGWHAMKRPRWRPQYSRIGTTLLVNLPLWMPLGLIGPVTAWLWWRERSPGPGRCPACGYSLEGIGGAVCPECGESGRL